jgi:hypothetical protein
LVEVLVLRGETGDEPPNGFAEEAAHVGEVEERGQLRAWRTWTISCLSVSRSKSVRLCSLVLAKRMKG